MSLCNVTGPVWRERLSKIDSHVDAISLPEGQADLEQDSEWCEVVVDGHRRRIRLHDYHEIYNIPGFYERLFYDRLKCCSPSRAAGLLHDVLADFDGPADHLRVLDLGAGNGMVGEELAVRGVEKLVGVDIIPEAKEAAERDRPGVYDQYFVVDLTRLSESLEERLCGMRLNCLTSVAALGFGDIPPDAFIKALDLIERGGWIALTIKEDFLRESDSSGFCRLIRQLNRQRIMQMEAYRRYRHRVSITGKPLYYVILVARKTRDVPDRMFDEQLESAAV